MNQRLMQRTTYTATCLSPVHIGSGNKFGKFDGAHVSGKWYVIDLDKALEKDIDPTSLAQAMNDRDFNWQSWLNRHKIKLAEVSAYSIPCLVPPAENEIREAVKDADLRPYLPGSSVKGALRTAIVWNLLKNAVGVDPRCGAGSDWQTVPWIEGDDRINPFGEQILIDAAPVVAGIVDGGGERDVQPIFSAGFGEAVEAFEREGEIGFRGLSDGQVDGQIVSAEIDDVLTAEGRTAVRISRSSSRAGKSRARG